MTRIVILLPYVKVMFWIVIIVVGIIYILYNRSRVKVVTLNDIVNYVNANKSIGVNAFVSKIDFLPKEIHKQLQRKFGLKKILHGYKDSTSVYVAVIDKEGKINSSSCFWGTKLDEELEIVFGNNSIINIDLN